MAAAAAPAGPGGDNGEHKHTNRLAQEESPYLLQHAHNPVRGAGLVHSSDRMLSF